MLRFDFGIVQDLCHYLFSPPREGLLLGPVYIHRVHSTLATKLTIAAKHLSVFS